MERRNVWVPGEVCMERLERGNYYRKVILNILKSAEVILAERWRTESIGVSSITEKGGVADEGRKLWKERLSAKR
jgi:hypothetical protein